MRDRHANFALLTKDGSPVTRHQLRKVCMHMIGRLDWPRHEYFYRLSCDQYPRAEYPAISQPIKHPLTQISPRTSRFPVIDFSDKERISIEIRFGIPVMIDAITNLNRIRVNWSASTPHRIGIMPHDLSYTMLFRDSFKTYLQEKDLGLVVDDMATIAPPRVQYGRILRRGY